MQKSARERFHTKLRRGAGFDKECNFNAIFILQFLPQRFHNLFLCYQQLNMISRNILYLIILHYLSRYLRIILNAHINMQSLHKKRNGFEMIFDAIGISSLNTFCNQKIVQVRLCSCSFNRMTDNFISSERVAQSGTKVRSFSQKF